MAVHTLQEAAELLRLPYRTLRDHVFAERWPHRRISQRRRLMTDEDIAAVLAMTTATPRPTADPSPMSARSMRANVRDLLTA